MKKYNSTGIKKSIHHAAFSLILYFLLNNSAIINNHVALALYADEVGLNDFSIATAGHGPVKSAWFGSQQQAVVITSNSHPPEGSFQINRKDIETLEGNFHYERSVNQQQQSDGCFVAGRNASTGSLLWRRNVCSTSTRHGPASSNPSSLLLRHSTTVIQGDDDDKASSGSVITLDDAGVLQKWDASSGSLLWNVKLGMFSVAPETIQTTTERVFPWKDNDAVIAVSYRFRGVGDNFIRVEEGLSIHSIHNGQPMYYKDDTGLQPLVIYAQDLLLSADVAAPDAKSSSKEATSTTSSARIISVHAINNRKLYIVAGYVSPQSVSTAVATSQIGIFHVEITHKQQYEVTKSIPLKSIMTTSRASPTYFVDVSLFRFAILAGSTTHYAITVTVPPPNSSPAEGKFYHLVSIPITPSTSSKGSVQILDWNAAESTISNIMVQDTDNIISVTATTSTTTVSRKNSCAVVNIHPDGQLRLVESSVQHDDGINKGLVTAVASTTRCGVSHTIFARIHFADQRHTRAYYSMQVVNLLENHGESTKEEIFFKDVPVDVLDPAKHGEIISIHALSCLPSGSTSSTTPTLKALASTRGGTTVMIQLSGRNSIAVDYSSTLWTAEEALAQIQSTTFVDIHPLISPLRQISGTTNTSVVMTAVDDEELPPSVTERWLQQWKSLKSLIPGIKSNIISSTIGQDEATERRNINFGFAKRAVVLTSNPPRLFGLDMRQRGKVAWSMLLTDDSSLSATSTTLFSKHSLIHSGKHGQHHANEILVISQFQETKHAENQTPALLIEWKCLDGVDGTELLSGTMELDGSKKIINISPIRIYTGVHTSGLATLKCRQQALLLSDDGSVEMVPSSKVGSEYLKTYLRDHNYFMHSIDRQKGELRSRNIKVSPDNATILSSLVGETIFPPDQEKIVSVTYPSPEEVVQSPVTILGDDALLLKYLNPHLAVIITEISSEYLNGIEQVKNSSMKSQLVSAFLSGGDLSSDSNREKAKKKPLGVTPTKAGEHNAAADIPPSPTSIQTIPSLFINLVDTVSGKLLHRASYSHFSGFADSLSASLLWRNIPVVISENWIVCAFWNHRTKRTEVLVLTLHDGMIDKHGITAFKRPQQETTFSSFESPKPIVLHRTFALSTEVTALGVTQTARGISMKHFLFALGTGQIVTVDRRFLDPRRPSGEPKPAEKAEGLLRYHPIIPLLPQHIATYNLPIEGVSLIKSVAAQVESQSMVFACGGPDVFFARLAPSKGFDLLPDNFNKGLLLAIVIALVGVVFIMQRISNVETLKATWF